MKHSNRGTTTVEFAIVGLLFMIVLFAVLEFGRLLFTWNALAEATRRGARLAAVCDPASAATVQSVAVFGTGGGGASPVLPDLTTGNVTVTYVGTALPETTSFVRVTIAGYNHPLLIPGLALTVTAPTFTTTLPVESQGSLPPAAGASCPI